MTAVSIVSPMPSTNAIPGPGSQSSRSVAQSAAQPAAPSATQALAGSTSQENQGHGAFAAVMARQQTREAQHQNTPGRAAGPDARPAGSTKLQPAADALPSDAAAAMPSAGGKNMPQAVLSKSEQNQSKTHSDSAKKTDISAQTPAGLVSSLLPGLAIPLPAPVPVNVVTNPPVNPGLTPSPESPALSKGSLVTYGSAEKPVSPNSPLLHLQTDVMAHDGKASDAAAHASRQGGLSPRDTGHLPQNLLHDLVTAVSAKQSSVPATINNNLLLDANIGLPKNVAESVSNLSQNNSPTLLAGMLPNNVTPSSSGQVLATPVGANPQWGEALGQQVQWLLGQDIQQARLQLNPPHLGPLEVHLDIQANGQANATFLSPHPEVLQAISNAIPQLQQSFAAAGMSLGQTNVGADGGGRYFSKNKPASTTSVKTLTEAGDSPAAVAMLRVQLGLINAFA